MQKLGTDEKNLKVLMETLCIYFQPLTVTTTPIAIFLIRELRWPNHDFTTSV